MKGQHFCAEKERAEASSEGVTMEAAPPVEPRHTVDESILEPYNYLANVPGKDVRSRLVDCFQVWLQIEPAKLEIIKTVIGMLHNASLLIDDIEDNSKMRRGVPVAHAIYGVPSTINCANYVYFLAMEKCTELEDAKCVSIFVKELLNLHRGQGQDILWRDQCKCPTEGEYKQMVSDKTGGLFRLAVSLMAVFVKGSSLPDFSTLIYLFGLYFQIRDDYMNVASAEYMKEKTFCEDLSEGKFSFPMIHCIRTNPGDKRLLNILRQRTEDMEVKRHAVQYITACGSLQYTREVLEDLYQQIVAEIEGPCGGHPALLGLLGVLHKKLARPEVTGYGAVPDEAGSSLSNGARHIVFGAGAGSGSPARPSACSSGPL